MAEGRGKKLRQEERDFIAARWAAGDTCDEIADALAEKGWRIVTDGCIRAWRFKMGLPRRVPQRSSLKGTIAKRCNLWPVERTAAVLADAKAGLSIDQISKKRGLTRGQVAGKLFRCAGAFHA